MPTETAQQWETVIGLEVHTQVNAASKMYCACAHHNGAELEQANSSVCPVCLGHPGTLPRPNRQVVVRALTLARKLHCRINERSVFARKNYFYPDLPKGYQISQFELPLAEDGRLYFWHAGQQRSARIRRIHLEEDTAKLFHLPDGTAALDYNRAGVPLIEIVSQPDFRSSDECVSYLEELRTLLQRLQVSDAAMEAGNFRCEPNISIRPVGESELRTKTELKNLNSFATLRRGIDSEVERQQALYAAGGVVEQATLRYDEARGITIPMRKKETADDYRYFEDPDLPPLLLTKALHDEAASELRDSGFELRARLVDEDGLTHEQAAILISDRTLHRFYRLACKDGHAPKQVANWVIGDFQRLLNDNPLHMEPGELSEILRLLSSGALTHVQAREVLAEVFLTGKTPDAVTQEKGYAGATGADELRTVCEDVIAANPKIAADVRGGKAAAVQVLVGQVMRATKGSANADAARDLLLSILNTPEVP